MLADISNVDAIYIVCGRTDMRKSIDGLCAIIQEQFSMEIDHALFLFCGRKCDRIKAILKEPDGIVMIYKRLTAQGSRRKKLHINSAVFLIFSALSKHKNHPFYWEVHLFSGIIKISKTGGKSSG